MDDTYLVEIRLARTKWRIKHIISSIAGHYHLENHMERHPHVTIFGPLVLKPGTTEQQLLAVIGGIAIRHDPVPFLIDSLEKREGMHGSVIAFSVKPSPVLVMLTATITQAILPITETMNAWDDQPEKKWFHVTIANRLDATTATKVFTRITSPEPSDNKDEIHPDFWIRLKSSLTRLIFSPKPVFAPVLLDETGLRLTVMKGEQILAEYDFLEKKWIQAGHDHKSRSWQATLREFRRFAGFESVARAAQDTENIFVISDLHFGHANIIRYCSRPFLYSDVEEMNTVLINNWNSLIAPQTKIFYVGDLRYGKGSLDAGHYRKQLNGRITFIEGNHDDRQLETKKSMMFEYDGIRFLLVHDPSDAPRSFDGWVIHGHYHNNDLGNFPFMNFIDRRINVSAEVIGYSPVSMQEICTLIRVHQESSDTAPVLLRYPYLS